MKILLLGLSGSGKTTIAKEISSRFSLNLYEADDEVKRIS
jgi:shikimate kinase